MRFALPITISSAGTALPCSGTEPTEREVPVQMTSRPDGTVEVLFVVDQPAQSTGRVSALLRQSETWSSEVRETQVSGEDLAWQVENAHLIVDFSKNPGTGRSGQINRIFVKRPGIWLSRERDQSTLHLSPNAAGHEHYLPVNRWDPPEKWRAAAPGQ